MLDTVFIMGKCVPISVYWTHTTGAQTLPLPLTSMWTCINYLVSLKLLFKVGKLWYLYERIFESIKWNTQKTQNVVWHTSTQEMLFKTTCILPITLIIVIIITVFITLLIYIVHSWLHTFLHIVPLARIYWPFSVLFIAQDFEPLWVSPSAGYELFLLTS